jgi:hypothetical protein
MITEIPVKTNKERVTKTKYLKVSDKEIISCNKPLYISPKNPNHDYEGREKMLKNLRDTLSKSKIESLEKENK